MVVAVKDEKLGVLGVEGTSGAILEALMPG